MYDAFYGLTQAPFGLSPDVYFCYRYRTYARAKAYMQYALHRGEGFAVVTGRPGMGKTTLIQDLLRDLGPRRQLLAQIDSTQLDADDLLRLVTYAFGLPAKGVDKASLIYGLREHLIARTATEGTAILIVDEAQNLSGRALEELRLITNLQEGPRPLVQILLVGQEPLRDLIRRPEPGAGSSAHRGGLPSGGDGPDRDPRLYPPPAPARRVERSPGMGGRCPEDGLSRERGRTAADQQVL